MTPMLANVAVPVFFPQPLLMLLALIPIVAVETLSLRRQFAVSYREVLTANVLSTLCGLPVAFLAIVLFDVALSGGDSSWWQVGLSSRIISHDLHHWWILPLAMLSVIVPCFALSVFLEGRYLGRETTRVRGRALWFAVIRAHCYSYLVLLALDCLWFTAKIA
jgi:hypothetical protein